MRKERRYECRPKRLESDFDTMNGKTEITVYADAMNEKREGLICMSTL